MSAPPSARSPRSPRPRSPGAGDKAYCAIQGVIAPKIRFELRLPTQGWTQRYLQVGCGGLCGVLNVRTEHADGCVPVQSGAIALASTDMGHEGKGGMAAMGDGTFGDRPAGARRFRLSRRPPDRRGVQGPDRQVLRPGAALQLFLRLLGRRTRRP
jgi:hypothetical protein